MGKRELPDPPLSTFVFCLSTVNLGDQATRWLERDSVLYFAFELLDLNLFIDVWCLKQVSFSCGGDVHI